MGFKHSLLSYRKNREAKRAYLFPGVDAVVTDTRLDLNQQHLVLSHSEPFRTIRNFRYFFPPQF